VVWSACLCYTTNACDPWVWEPVAVTFSAFVIQGKSLSLLCGAMTWLRDHEAREDAYIDSQLSTSSVPSTEEGATSSSRGCTSVRLNTVPRRVGISSHPGLGSQPSQSHPAARPSQGRGAAAGGAPAQEGTCQSNAASRHPTSNQEEGGTPWKDCQTSMLSLRFCSATPIACP